LVLTDVDKGLAEAMDWVTQAYINASNSLAAYNKGQMKVIENTSFLTDFIGQAFQGMSNSISDALNSTEGVLKSFGKFFGNFIKGLIFRLVAATIAALALAMVISLIPGFGGATAFKAVKAATTFGAMTKAGIGVFMAEGGAVSGPTLGMLGEASNISRSNPEFIGTAAQLGLDKIGGQQSINPKTVKFVIEQDQLVGLLEMYNNQRENF